MKKLLIPLFLLLCSCNIPQSRTTFGKSDAEIVYEEVVEEVEKRVLSEEWMEKRIEKHWYEGHEYLVIVPVGRYVRGMDVLGFEHNPNCPCFKEE